MIAHSNSSQSFNLAENAMVIKRLKDYHRLTFGAIILGFVGGSLSDLQHTFDTDITRGGINYMLSIPRSSGHAGKPNTKRKMLSSRRFAATLRRLRKYFTSS